MYLKVNKQQKSRNQVKEMPLEHPTSTSKCLKVKPENLQNESRNYSPHNISESRLTPCLVTHLPFCRKDVFNI